MQHKDSNKRLKQKVNKEALQESIKQKKKIIKIGKIVTKDENKYS
jgi:hypothetical protein